VPNINKGLVLDQTREGTGKRKEKRRNKKEKQNHPNIQAQPRDGIVSTTNKRNQQRVKK
jgi:hypothetical protein